MPSHRNLSINFNVLLTPELDSKLIRLAKIKGISKAHIVRQAIGNWDLMDQMRTPVCADGQKCRCPHAHIYAPSQPPADPPSKTPPPLHANDPPANTNGKH